MSSEGYSGVTLSPGELRRLEQERQRQIEEARQLELQRLEAQRIAEQRRQVNEARSRISVVDQFEDQATRIKAALSRSAPSMSKENPKVVEEQIRETCDFLDNALRQLPTGISPELDQVVERLRRSTTFLRSEGSRQPAITTAALQGARLELEYVTRRHRELVVSQIAEAEQLLVEARVMRRLALHDTDAAQANALEEDLLAFVRTPPSSEARQQLVRLKAQLHELAQDVDQLARNAAERRRVLSIVEATLDAMGYRVMSFTPTDPLVECRAVEAGNGDRIEFEFGLDRNVHFAFEPANGLSSSEAVDRCRNWCAQYEQLVRQMRQAGLSVQEHWRRPPDRAAAAPKQQRDREQKRRRRPDLKRRTV